MSIYTTPLQFGYFFCLLLWMLLLVRGYSEQRLSDRMLGWIMFILAMELQDYTFGFAGINILWNELNGFPRSVSLLFGPIVYFYFLAQTNRAFRLQRQEIWHFLPYALYFFYNLFFFVQGPDAVLEIQASNLNLVMGYVMRIGLLLSFTYYLYHCLVIYKGYRIWSNEQFSNLEIIDFKWFRNFIYCMIFWLVFRELMFVLDAIFFLDFYQDWWWNLGLVVVAIYIGIAGYTQTQPAQIAFTFEAPAGKPENRPVETVSPEENAMNHEKITLANKLHHVMEEERIFLQPDLNLHELAQHLQTNPVQLSAAINQVFGKNFNDYINGLRVEEFIKKYSEDSNRRYTLLSLALDSGFNSKSTFNRAFKKIKGSSPQDFLNG